MLTATLRESGGSVIMTVPKAILAALGWSASSRVGMTVRDQKLVIERPKYTLDELLAEHDFSAFRDDIEAWDHMPTAGREVF
jgi:antitoxin ChpS